MPKSNKRKTRRNDPFARPPHPLGYRFLSDERPLRATRFDALLPGIVAKYGLGRKINADRFQKAWCDALKRAFAEQEEFYEDAQEDWNDDAPNKLEMFLKYARAVSFRGGVLRVEVVSNLFLQELQFYQIPILHELRQLLPNDKIDKIKFVAK